MSAPENGCRTASRWVKWGTSAVIVVHFLAILTAVIGLGVGYAPPPRLCAQANQRFAPYLELVFLQNPYRFYAPNPGCDPTMWVRISYSDGGVRWRSFPQPPQSAAPVLRQRLLAMPRSAVETIPVGPFAEDVALTPMSQICLASYIRGIVRRDTTTDELGLPLLAEDVTVYRIDKRCMQPFQAREGWEFTDLRLHQATYLGTYFVNGRSREGPRGEPISMPSLAAQIIQESFDTQGAKHEIATTAMPRPIAAFLEAHPEVVHGARSDLAERVRVAMEGQRLDKSLAVVPLGSTERTALAVSTP